VSQQFPEGSGYQNLASVFNKYFTSLPDTTSVSNPVNTSSSQANVSPLDYLKLSFTKPFSKIQLPPVTRNEIIAIVKSLKSTNSHGYDGISPKVLKTSLPFIYLHLYIYMQFIFTEGYISISFKVLTSNST